ncbi:hypothetical protein BPAE_0268g00150 [Botrytis paeoniae]|uniref:Uncharacterized protein n=1 Tax=Botrytis paeoniae TaxID=278948 RepID=A0A4Z1FH18_9HELO|nr:hypothetical protein BPAE_0268g00150 [Botrytis paeoniae]
MDYPFSDRWFEHESRRKELLMLHQLRKQNSAVDDVFFPYGLVLAHLPPWQLQPVLHDQYTVGSDVERTVTHQTDAWLFCIDRGLKQVSWSHKTFLPYQYDQQVAEQRIGKILVVAKLEQSKVDADSIPWKYTCPDSTKLSGQLRWFPHGYEQHIDLFLKYNFLIVQNYPRGSCSHIRGPGINKYMYAVANAPVGSPIAQVANPPKFFHSLPETQYESLFKKRVILLAPKRVLNIVHESQPRDFIQVPLSQGSEYCTLITKDAIPDYAIPSSLTGGSISGPDIIKTEFPLNSIQVPTPQGPEVCTEIKKEEFPHSSIQLASCGEIRDGLKIKEEDAPHILRFKYLRLGALGGVWIL